jgi:hypothetical protein
MGSSLKLYSISGLIVGILIVTLISNVVAPIINVDSNSQNKGCTNFTASYGDRTLHGGNEDYNVTDYYYVVVPPNGKDYGYIYFTYGDFLDFPNAGMNEKGYCYTINGLAEASLNHNPELSQTTPLDPKLVLEICATVEDAIDIVENSYLGDSWAFQFHDADATGDAVVYSVGADGKLALTRKEKGDGYLVSTNFNLANPENRHPLAAYPCWRYEKAVEMLEEINDEDYLTIAKFRSILDAVHLEGPDVIYKTHTSLIFDLNNGVIYIYRFHNYDEVIELNLEKEFAKGTHRGLVSDLFLQEKLKTAEAPVTTSTETLTSKPASSSSEHVTQTIGFELNTIGLVVIIIIAIVAAFFITKRKKS